MPKQHTNLSNLSLILQGTTALILISSSIILTGCKPKSEQIPTTLSQEEGIAWVETAQLTLKPFKKQLMAALTAGMEKGPDVAIEVCKIQAPAIAQSVGSEKVTIGRTTHKLRNPQNAAKLWTQPLLANYLADPFLKEPVVIEIDPQTIGYVEPIFMKGKCLNCHGSNLKPEVKAQLAKMYPGDEAIGFAEGDFRGLFWVEIKKDTKNQT